MVMTVRCSGAHSEEGHQQLDAVCVQPEQKEGEGETETQSESSGRSEQWEGLVCGSQL